MELADLTDSKSVAKACGFESHHEHHIKILVDFYLKIYYNIYVNKNKEVNAMSTKKIKATIKRVNIITNILLTIIIINSILWLGFMGGLEKGITPGVFQIVITTSICFISTFIVSFLEYYKHKLEIQLLKRRK